MLNALHITKAEFSEGKELLIRIKKIPTAVPDINPRKEAEDLYNALEEALPTTTWNRLAEMFYRQVVEENA